MTVELVSVGDVTTPVSIILAFLVPESDEPSTGKVTLASASGKVTLTMTDASSPAGLVLAITTFFELVDAIRLLSDEVLSAIDHEDSFATPGVVVESLSMASPLELGLRRPSRVFGVLYFFARRSLALREQFHRGSITSAQASIARSTASTIEAQARLIDQRTRSLAIDNDRKELMTTSTLLPALLTALNFAASCRYRQPARSPRR